MAVNPAQIDYSKWSRERIRAVYNADQISLKEKQQELLDRKNHFNSLLKYYHAADLSPGPLDPASVAKMEADQQNQYYAFVPVIFAVGSLASTAGAVGMQEVHYRFFESSSAAADLRKALTEFVTDWHAAPIRETKEIVLWQHGTKILELSKLLSDDGLRRSQMDEIIQYLSSNGRAITQASVIRETLRRLYFVQSRKAIWGYLAGFATLTTTAVIHFWPTSSEDEKLMKGMSVADENTYLNQFLADSAALSLEILDLQEEVNILKTFNP
jgi:hypothetical protein